MATYKVSGTINKQARVTAKPVGAVEIYAANQFSAGAYELQFTAPSAVDTFVCVDDGYAVKNEVTTPIEVV